MARFGWIVVAYFVAIAVALVATQWIDWSLLFADTGIDGRHPLMLAFAADVIATIVIFGFSVAFSNSSFYDAYWSVAPPLLMGFWWWFAGGVVDARIIAAVFILAWWALRLTHNWARGWHGLQDQDWRYIDLQNKLGIWYWPVSFLGIHLMPTVWVFLGCVALYVVVQPAAVAVPWNLWDTAGLLVGIAAVAIEARADNELRDFREQRADVSENLSTGVWGWCRHPNYLGEIGFWVSLALFATGAAGVLWWVWLGPILIFALFAGVTIRMQEQKLLAAKPTYTDYVSTTYSLLPLSKILRRS